MDFLFAPLPETNFQMNTEELRLWQRNAIFECECDNFINRRIEARQMHQVAPQHRPLFELYGIDAAIQQHGLRLPGAHGNIEQRNSSININHRVDDDDNRADANANIAAPLRQRRRLMATNASDQDRDNMLDRLYQEALFTAFRTRGLSAIRNP
ncbi:uncharacterized protein LOC118754318 [Rhagoletis pomonella]|uniref:uncharacterized protein LOC118754112 n=1 Tax=Rhagoletis pomonella TaxID=28610 RepID=UPI00177B050F|nr:uncharacterized protein LOC118754112 [Rhagoletis pomonella]XP_036345086.1 uncharacterized protein LOC118754318 [Rhagoletis pomonella]